MSEPRRSLEDLKMRGDFVRRHIGPGETQIAEMLGLLGLSSLDELIDKTVPAAIRSKTPMDLPRGRTEAGALAYLRALAERKLIRITGRSDKLGSPLKYETTKDFLDHFGLDSLEALPGVAELKAAGLLDSRPAIAALGVRGDLLPAGSAAAADDDLGETEAELPLAADFGAHLLPGDSEPHADAEPQDAEPQDAELQDAEPHEDEDDPARGGSGEIEVTGPDDAAPALGETDAQSPKAADAPGRDGEP